MAAVNPEDYKTYGEFQDAITARPKFQEIPKDSPRRTQILNYARDKFYEAHGVHMEIGPTDIIPPDPIKKDGAGTAAPLNPDSLKEDKLTKAPDTVLRGDPAPAKEPLGPKQPPEGPDLMGRIKAGAEGGLEKLKGAAGSMSGALDPIALLVHALPGDNIQAGIDAAMSISMLTGAGEVEGAGGLAYKALRSIPDLARGSGRLLARMAIPAAGGLVGGATEGKAGRGALQGAGEQIVGETISGVGRGLFGLSNKAIQKTDFSRMSNWLRERVSNFPGIKVMGDFRKVFIRGEWQESAEKELKNVEKDIGKQLDAVVKKQPKANIFSPQGQDTAQQEALQSVGGQSTVFSKKEPFELPESAVVDKGRGIAPMQHMNGSTPDAGVQEEQIAFGNEGPKKPTVFAAKGPKEQAYQKVKDIEAELKAARASIPKMKAGGSGLSAENAEITKRAAEAEAKIKEIQTRLANAQKEARAITKGKSKAPIDLDSAVAESKRRAAAGEGLSPDKPSAYEPSKPTISRELEIELPGPAVDYLAKVKGIDLPRRAKYPFEFETYNEYIREIENKGWALVNSTNPEQAEWGRSLRSTVFQMESNGADAIRQKIGDKAAREWLASRRQYRAARALTELFRSPGLVSDSGKMVHWDQLQKLVDQAGREGFYDDLKLAFGKKDADGFIDQLTRGNPNERDIPGRGILTSHTRVYAHPNPEKMGLRIPFQVPIPTVRAGDVPYNLGRNRALSALLVLGPERFAQMMFDIVKISGASAEKHQQASR